MQENKEKLFNRNFILLGIAGFLMFFAFYMLSPVIAMYIIDRFNSTPAMTGVVVSAYIVTALLVRPFSGYLVDKYDRKKFLIITLSSFAILVGGYLLVDSIFKILILRIFLGASFALVTTASNTLVIDVLPSNRRGEGIGYFGAIIIIAMAIGPMLGTFLMEFFSYTMLFMTAFTSASLAMIIGLFIKVKPRARLSNVQAISLDRFFLRSGLSMALVMALLYFLSGAITSYMSLYVKESGLEISAGNFFLFLAMGIIASRIFAGKLLNKGRYHQLLMAGFSLLIVASLMLIMQASITTFLLSALLLGGGYGLMSPTIQTMIVNLTDHSRRGTANSTYFIALDFGSGLGMLMGGSIASISSYKMIFVVSSALVFTSFLLYVFYSKKDYFGRLKRIN